MSSCIFFRTLSRRLRQKWYALAWLLICSRYCKEYAMKTIGMIILVIGILMTVFTGFNIVTKKKVVDLGPVEINKEEKTPIYWSPITGGILIVVGAITLVMDRRKA
jgi:hypothetical protein